MRNVASPLWGRGREAMTYDRVRQVGCCRDLDGAIVSHLAELVRGHFFPRVKAPSSRPSGTFSPRGEGRSPITVGTAQFAGALLSTVLISLPRQA